MQEEIAVLKHQHQKGIEDMKANMTEKDASVEEKNQALEGLEQEKKELELKASKYQVCTVVFIDRRFCCVLSSPGSAVY